MITPTQMLPFDIRPGPSRPKKARSKSESDMLIRNSHGSPTPCAFPFDHGIGSRQAARNDLASIGGDARRSAEIQDHLTKTSLLFLFRHVEWKIRKRVCLHSVLLRLTGVPLQTSVKSEAGPFTPTHRAGGRFHPAGWPA
jgi:hypothetical protein